GNHGAGRAGSRPSLRSLETDAGRARAARRIERELEAGAVARRSGQGSRRDGGGWKRRASGGQRVSASPRAGAGGRGGVSKFRADAAGSTLARGRPSFTRRTPLISRGALACPSPR